MFSKHHFFKSIIILIILLSLTISIFILPTSAIVTGNLSPADIYPLFDMEHFNYITVRNSSSVVYTPDSYFKPFTVYPYFESTHQGIVDSDGMLYYNRFISDGANSLANNEYFRFWLPIGIQNSPKVTIQFVILCNNVNGSTGPFPDYLFRNCLRNSVANDRIRFFLQTSEGTIDLKSSVFEYDGIVQLSATPPSASNGGTNAYTYGAKVFDIEIQNIADVNTLYVDFSPRVSINSNFMGYISFGITKIYYEGANAQLTGIQDSINDLISGIENQGSILQDMTEQQAEFYDEVLQLSPEGEQILQDVKDNFSSSESGLGEIIDVLEGIDKPPSAELLPDQEIIMGQYLDSGGQDGIDNVITPLFEEGGVIYIMLFSVLSIALVSYVLYGKKAR